MTSPPPVRQASSDTARDAPVDPWLVALALAVLLLALVGIVRAPVPGIDGQLVFQPVVRIDPPGPGGPAVVVLDCTPTEQGLRVQGRVDVDEATRPPDRVVRIAVTGGAADASGEAVGAGFAAQAGLTPGSAPGSFVVELPWATPASSFAVVGPVGTGSVAPGLGPIASCPPT
jgi:hypothetical protein